MHHKRSSSPIPRSQDWTCGPSACIYVCVYFSFALLVLLPCLFSFTLASRGWGGLINNIRGWALGLCVYICIVWIVDGSHGW